MDSDDQAMIETAAIHAEASVAQTEAAAEAAVAVAALEEQGETERAQLLAQALEMRDDDRAHIAALEARVVALEAAVMLTAAAAAEATEAAEEAQATADEAAAAPEAPAITELDTGSAAAEEEAAPPPPAEERHEPEQFKTRHQRHRDRRLR